MFGPYRAYLCRRRAALLPSHLHTPAYLDAGSAFSLVRPGDVILAASVHCFLAFLVFRNADMRPGPVYTAYASKCIQFHGATDDFECFFEPHKEVGRRRASGLH